MARGIPPIQRGEIIKAKRLNEYGDRINDLTQTGIKPPFQGDGIDPNIPLDSATGPNIYNETTRTVSEVQVFDDEMENYALIDRIDSVTFENSEGETITLQFNNT